MIERRSAARVAADDARFARARALLLRGQARPLQDDPDESTELLAAEAETALPVPSDRRLHPMGAVGAPRYDRRRLGIPALEAGRPDTPEAPPPAGDSPG